MPEMLAEARMILAEEFWRFTRGKAYIIITLSVPAILLALMVAIPIIRDIAGGGEEEGQRPIGIVVLSGDLALAPDDLPAFLAFDDRKEASDALEEKAVEEVFVIPEDYLATGSVEWLHSTGGIFSGVDPKPSDTGAAVVSAFLRTALAAEELEPELLIRAVGGAFFVEVRIGDDGTPNKEDVGVEIGTAIVSLAAAVLLMFSIVIGASSLVQAIAEEKENRMIEVLLTSVKPMSLMAGKVLAIGTAELIMVAVWVASIIVIGPRLFDVIPDAPSFPVNLGVLAWLVAFFLAGYFVSVVILSGVGAMATGVREATQLSMVVIMPLVTPMYLLYPIMSNPDGIVARVMSFIPITAPVTMMFRLAVGGSSMLETTASLVLTVLTGVVLLWASARVFRAGLLMYGQRMNFRGVMRALRESE